MNKNILNNIYTFDEYFLLEVELTSNHEVETTNYFFFKSPNCGEKNDILSLSYLLYSFK